MPCCAFAAFLVSQLIFALAGIKRFIFGAGDARATARLARNSVVEWRLGSASAALATVPARRAALWQQRQTWGWGLALAAVIEVALLVGGVYSARAYFAGAESPVPNASQHSPFCGSH